MRVDAQDVIDDLSEQLRAKSRESAERWAAVQAISRKATEQQKYIDDLKKEVAALKAPMDEVGERPPGP